MNETRLTEILNESDPAKQSIALNNVTIELLKQSDRNQKIQWVFTGILIATCIVCMTFMAYENSKMRQEVVDVVANYQTEFLEFMQEFEFVIEETTTTETTYDQEVSGDSAEINNVEGNQYKDSATHNEGVDPEWQQQDKPLNKPQLPQE